MNKEILFGKNEQERIVSLEDKGNGFVDLYIQNDNGLVTKKEVGNEYWILTDEPADEMSIELAGNNYYKYKNPFSLRQDWEFAKRHFQNNHDRRAYFINDHKEAFMTSQGHSYYKGLKPSEVVVLAFDIETTSLDPEDPAAKVLLISNTFRNHQGKIERKLFSYEEYANDGEMLKAWCAWVCEKDPSIILGHNIFGFDLPYLDGIASRHRIELNLGREGQAIRFNKWDSKFRKDASQFYDYKKAFIIGREIIDTFFLSIRYDIGRKYETYKLKSIIEQEGLEVKGRQHYDASLIRKNYRIPKEWEKIKAYAKFDADDALSLFDLMAPPFFYIAQSVPKSFQEIICSASGSQLNSMMVRSYLQEGGSLPKASLAVDYEGAISIGRPGIHRNVLKVDVASLYPSIMIEYEIYDKYKDPKGYFKEIVQEFTKQRLDFKKKAKTDKYYEDRQAALKILINSCYGFLGSSGLLFNSPHNAALITEKGREVLIKSIEWATGDNYTKWRKAHEL